MSLLSRFFSGDDDPTRDWPRERRTEPADQPRSPGAGVVQHQRHISARRSKPCVSSGGRTTTSHRAKDSCTLTYDRWGLLVEFEQGAMYQVSFLIGEMHRSGQRPELVLAEPRGPDGLGLNPRTTKDELLHRFGQPRNAAGPGGHCGPVLQRRSARERIPGGQRTADRVGRVCGLRRERQAGKAGRAGRSGRSGRSGR